MQGAWLQAEGYGPLKVLVDSNNSSLARLRLWMVVTSSILVTLRKMN